MTVHFPRLLLRERSHSWNLVGTATTPGQTAQSVAPLIRSDGGGFWTCQMGDISLSGGAVGATGKQRQRLATLLWRAVRQVCDGGVNPIVVPRNDALFRPWPVGVAQGDPSAILHSDDTTFNDGTGYYQSVIDITCDGGAALRATSMDIAINVGDDLVGGESFSVLHLNMGWRLYEIATVDGSTITFLPPLREAIADGTQLEFDRPRCVMRLANPNSMDLSISPWTFNQASVQFVETFT